MTEHLSFTKSFFIDLLSCVFWNHSYLYLPQRCTFLVSRHYRSLLCKSPCVCVFCPLAVYCIVFCSMKVQQIRKVVAMVTGDKPTAGTKIKHCHCSLNIGQTPITVTDVKDISNLTKVFRWWLKTTKMPETNATGLKKKKALKKKKKKTSILIFWAVTALDKRKIIIIHMVEE